MTEKSNFPYLHGFSSEEQERLRQQARFAEFTVYQDINLSKVRNLLEVGCGVGAQSEIIMRRFPNLKLTGIDLNTAQLEEAKRHLATIPWAINRYEIQEMNAAHLDLPENKFDGGFLCWILEHVPNPAQVLSEVRRVLQPGSTVYVTEVLNSSFLLDPYSPNVWKYWQAFNDYQIDMGGDPFVGAKLGNLLMKVGFSDIQTKVKTWHLDNRAPGKRKEFIDYWKDLLLSASDQLIAEKRVDQETVDLAEKELNLVSKDPDAVFYYSFIQAQAKVS